MARASIWKPLFIEQLRLTGNVSEAASVAGISRDTAYKARYRSEKFAAQWDEALEEACDRMEREAFRRAVEGIDKPIYYQGQKVDLLKEYSDTLLIFLLKSHRPEKYQERKAIDVTSGGEKLPPIRFIEVEIEPDDDTD